MKYEPRHQALVRKYLLNLRCLDSDGDSEEEVEGLILLN